MTGTRWLITFFRVVPPVPRWMTGTLVVTVVVCGTLLAAGMTGPGEALAPVFLLHTLAASSGFAVPAARGHYDLLLTGGATRLRIGLAHWTASVAPGVAAWLVVAAIEALVDRGFPHVSLSSGTVVAVWVMSTLSWGSTVSLPRMTGGILWLLVAVLAHGVTWRGSPLWGALLPLARPGSLVGANLAGSDVAAVIPAVLVATAAAAGGLLWIQRADISLQVAR